MKCTNDGKCHCMCDVGCDKCDCCIDGHWNGPGWKEGLTIHCSENCKLMMIFMSRNLITKLDKILRANI